MINPYAILASGAAVLMLLGGSYLKGRTDGAENATNKYEERIRVADVIADAREASDRLARDDSDRSYLDRIRSLEASLLDPMPVSPIRLCKPASSNPAPEAPAAAGGADAASPAREYVLQDGRDLRGELVQYSKTCESLRIQVDEFQLYELKISAE